MWFVLWVVCGWWGGRGFGVLVVECCWVLGCSCFVWVLVWVEVVLEFVRVVSWCCSMVWCWCEVSIVFVWVLWPWRWGSCGCASCCRCCPCFGVATGVGVVEVVKVLVVRVWLGGLPAPCGPPPGEKPFRASPSPFRGDRFKYGGSSFKIPFISGSALLARFKAG